MSESFEEFIKIMVDNQKVQLPLDEKKIKCLRRLYNDRFDTEKEDLEKRFEEEVEEDEEDEEEAEINEKSIATSFKNMTFNVLSMPVSNEATKRKELETKLNNDKFLNKYVDKKLNKYLLKYINADVKAVIIYGYHFKTTLDD